MIGAQIWVTVAVHQPARAAAPTGGQNRSSPVRLQADGRLLVHGRARKRPRFLPWLHLLQVESGALGVHRYLVATINCHQIGVWSRK